jgi:hypothetical protein
MIEYITIPVTAVSLAAALALAIKCRRVRSRLAVSDELVEAAEQRALDATIDAQLHKDRLDRENAATVAAKVKEFEAKFDADSTHLLSQALAGTASRALVENVREVIDARFTRVSQEFVGALTDNAEGIIRDLNFNLCEKVWDSFQGFKLLNKETPYIFPDNVRLAYTKGNRTVMVVEQKPQVRTVSFAKSLIESKAEVKAAVGSSEGSLRYSLSFPYIYFVLVFDGGQYSYHELYFRNKPLTSVREHVYMAPIPNVWNTKKDGHYPMCMGADFDDGVTGTIARQCEMAVGHFWQARFSSDLGDGDPGKVDKRIKNYATWQKHSAEDPLFILTVNWKKGRTIKGVVERILENREHTAALDPIDKEIRETLESGVADLATRVRDEIVAAKRKGFDQFNLDHQSLKTVEQVVIDHSKRVFARRAAQD